jgi:Domain of unknown function (DUF4382)
VRLFLTKGKYKTMKRNNFIFLGAIAGLASVVALAGCGGSGGNTNITRSTQTTLYVTDSPREDYAHVWATIYHAEIVAQDGTKTVLFDDTAGHTIDLKTLRDESGALYSFLGSATLASGTYTGVNVTVGTTMQLIKKGATTGDSVPVDAAIPLDANGHPVLSVTFKKPKVVTATSGTSVVVDFDLARFIVRNSKVLPTLVEGTGEGLGRADRHRKSDNHGTVSNLTGTAPNLSFTLTRRDGTTVIVNTTAATALSGTTAIADGSVVAVVGTVNSTTQVLVATSVEVRPAGSAIGVRTPHVHGTASAIDATAGTFSLAIVRAGGFTVTTTSVKVVTNASTTYQGDAGATQTQVEFFASLATMPNVSVEGTLDSATNTLTATRVKVDDESKDGGWEKDNHGFRGGKGGDKETWGNGAKPKR